LGYQLFRVANSNPYSDANTHTEPNPVANPNADTYSDAVANPNADTYSDANTHTESNPVADTDSNSNAGNFTNRSGRQWINGGTKRRSGRFPVRCETPKIEESYQNCWQL
jgi:hypothetical protein